MSQSHGSNSQGLHTSVAGKLLLRKLIECKTFYILLFLLKFFKKRSLGSSNFSWKLKHEIFFHSTIARFGIWTRSGCRQFGSCCSSCFWLKKWETKDIPKMVKSRKVHDWKVCCHQWPHCCKKKFGSKSRPGFCVMYKAELEKARKEKRPIAPNLNVLREIIWSKSFYWLSAVEVFW